MNFPPLKGYENMDRIRKAIEFNLSPEDMHLLEDMKYALNEPTKKRIEHSEVSLKTIADFIKASEGRPDVDDFINAQLDDWNTVMAHELANGRLR